MPLKVGELFATMRLDSKQFDQALSETGSRFDKLGSLMQRGTKAAARVFAATTAAAVGLGTSALRVGLDYNRMQQTSRAALTTLLGSTEAVNEQMAKLDEFAATSPFAKQVFIQAQQQLIGFGMSAEKVIPTLDAVQNAVAAVGGSNEDISEITRILATVTSSGKITAETLNQLGVRGVDAATLIGKAMGMTGQEVRDSITNGTLEAGEAVDALVAGMTDAFGGATDLVKQQMDGAADRVKGAWRDIGSVLATPLIDPSSGGQLVEWTNLFADGLRQIQKHAGPVTDMLWTRFTPGIEAVTTGMQKAVAAIASWDSSSLERGLDKMGAYAPLIAGTSAALFAMGTEGLPILSTFGISGINPVVAGLAALVAFSPQLRGLGGDLLEALKPGIAPAKELAEVLGDFLMDAIDILAPALSQVATAGGDLAVVFLNLLVPAVKAITTVATPVVQIAAGLVDAFAGLPTPVLAAVAAFAAMKALNLDKMFTGIKALGANIFAPMIESFQASKAVGHALGVELTGMQAAMLTAKTGAMALGGALKSALIANAPMLALSALVSVLGYFADQTAQAEARADSFRAALKDVAIGSDEAYRAVQQLAYEMAVTGDNIEWGWLEKAGPAGADSFAEALKRAGSSAQEFAAAIAGSDAEFEAYVEKLNEGAYEAGLSAAAHTKLIDQTERTRTAQADAKGTQEQLNDAMASGADVAQAQTDAYQAAADAANRLRQAEQDLAAAKGNLVMAQYASADALTNWGERVAEAGGLVKDQNGAIEQSGDAWREYETGVISARDALMREMEAAVKAGEGQEALDARLEKGLANIYGTGDAITGLEGATADYVDTIGGVPEYKSTIFEADTGAAYEDIRELLAEVQNSTGTLTIDANDNPALERLMASLGFVNDGTGIYTIDANSDEATAELLLSLLNVDTSTGIMGIDANNAEAMARLKTTADNIDRTWEDVKIGAKDRTEPVRSAVKRRIDTTQAAVQVGAKDHTGPTVSDIIRSINSRVASITVRAVGGASAMEAMVGADGGIFQAAAGVQTFGDGGFSTLPTQATVMPGRGKGLMQWAEDETYKEAFIPYALAKRRRAVQVLGRVANHFGFELYQPPSYAEGGLRGPGAPRSSSPGAGGTTVNYYDYSTTINPVAEPKSTTKRKQGQVIAAGVNRLG